MEPAVVALVALVLCCCCCYCCSSMGAGYMYYPIQIFLTCFASDGTCKLEDIPTVTAENLGLFSGICDICKEKGISNAKEVRTNKNAGGEWGKQKVAYIQPDGTEQKITKAAMCYVGYMKL